MTLLPCPFCGKQPESHWSASWGWWVVGCLYCPTQFVGDTEQQSAEKWNRRAPTQPEVETVGGEFFILSLLHSPADGNALWWGPNNSGYTQELERAGRYTMEQVEKEQSYYNNGDSTRAFPVSEALRIGRSGTKVNWLDAKHISQNLSTQSPQPKEGQIHE